ncbi:MAG: hypothetical protein IPO41_11580 [Acidobacteria bacterium]|nr:hypothetical protein [Acidobacteriota bacterium]MBP7476631.1 hypothetical protein [Pyrinomonadaceae bacterium]MBP9110781.1 hypothetical protein [Pyrinomonadaceae bacterium]
MRSKKDWRSAAVSKIVDQRIVLTVCSPSGYTYRLRREFDTVIAVHKNVPVLVGDETENWRDNFCRYDVRW